MIGNIIFLNIENDKIIGLVERHNGNSIKPIGVFEYKIDKTIPLRFYNTFGSRRRFKIAGVNNLELYKKMYEIFNKDKDLFKHLFRKREENLNLKNEIFYSGVKKCYIIKEELLKSEQSITADTPNLLKLDSVLKFGKYKGKTVEALIKIDIGYLQWLNKNGSNFHKSVEKILR